MEAYAQPKISVINLVKSFGSNRVLEGIDLDVLPGESVVVVGGSGAGKTVLIKHLIGLHLPDEGHVVVDGIDLTAAPAEVALALRKRFGMSFQEGALFDSMSVFDNVAFPLRRHTRRSRAAIAERVRECLRLVGLDDVEPKMPAELSGGMRRRVGFARAIALEPEILLFDEPTTGLDPINTARIASVINTMRRHLQITSVTITHDMNLAMRIADRIAMLRHGRILALAPPDEFAELTDPYVRAFLNGEVPEDEEEKP
jgi:phospholipid/cholesterol/gamma-HCH transport system ATP-binding protein